MMMIRGDDTSSTRELNKATMGILIAPVDGDQRAEGRHANNRADKAS